MRRRDRAEIERRLRELGGGGGAPERAGPEGVPCPSGQVLDRYRRGELESVEARELAFHLLRCPACTREVLLRERVERRAARAAALAEVRDAASAAMARVLAPIRRAIERAGEALRGRMAVRTAAVLAAAAAVLLIVLVGRVDHGPLSRAAIVGDRGAVRAGGGAALVRGEGFHLEIILARPAAILALLEGPGGGIERVYPAEGPTSFAGPGAVRIPGDAGAAWDSSGLEPGEYAIWVVALPRVVDAPSLDRLGAILERALREAARRAEGAGPRLEAGRAALRGAADAIERLPFRVEP